MWSVSEVPRIPARRCPVVVSVFEGTAEAARTIRSQAAKLKPYVFARGRVTWAMFRDRVRTFRSRIGRWASVSPSSFATIFSAGQVRNSAGSYSEPSQKVAVEICDRPRQKAEG